MLSRSFRQMPLRGFVVKIDPSWLLIAALVMAAFGLPEALIAILVYLALFNLVPAFVGWRPGVGCAAMKAQRLMVLATKRGCLQASSRECR